MQAIKVKYSRDVEKINKLEVGDWIDLRCAERTELKKGEYKAIPSMKATGTAHDAYATGRTMKESIVNLQKAGKYIQLTKTTPFITREYQTNNYVDANVGQWDIVG